MITSILQQKGNATDRINSGFCLSGNAQGKYQPHGSLGSDRAYLSKMLHSVQEITIKDENSNEYQEGKLKLCSS